MLDAENVEYYLLGDLNCDLGSPDLESNSRSLIGITELYGLHQLAFLTPPFLGYFFANTASLTPRNGDIL